MNCYQCGKPFQPLTWNVKYCSQECQQTVRRRKKLEDNKRYQARKHGKKLAVKLPMNESKITVIRDPDDNGGFPPSAEFSSIVFSEILFQGYCTPGTVISLHGKQCQVVGDPLTRQELIEL